MQTILWLYESPLIPEKGGTERITDLIMTGLKGRGYKCMAMLVGHKDGTFYLQDEPIADLLQFLKDNHVDVVINQMAYQQWLLDSFLEHGGREWQKNGGRIISCLHFDPEQPTYLSTLLRVPHKTLHDYIQIAKLWVFYHRYHEREIRSYANLYNHIYDHSDRLVLLSETHYPYIKSLMGRDDYSKLFAINNPLTFEDISSEDILPQKKRQVLIVARMDEFYKRISYALKAWRMVTKSKYSEDWELDIVGEGPSLDDYKEYVRKYHVPNVRFMGQQTPEPYYRDASIFLMTSSKEGWGLTITESLQRGVVPIAMESCPVFREIIEDGKNGFITPEGNIKAFSQKILLLMQYDAILIRMAKSALQSAHMFTIKSTLDKWEQILKAWEVLN